MSTPALKIGMTYEEVLKLIGQPLMKISPEPYTNETWHYPSRGLTILFENSYLTKIIVKTKFFEHTNYAKQWRRFAKEDLKLMQNPNTNEPPNPSRPDSQS